MRSILRRAALLAVVSFAPALLAAEAPRDPIEGRWLGTIGTPRERVAAGLEFVRDAASGELKLKLTLPAINSYGNDAGAPVTRNGNRVEVAPIFLALELKDGKLEGHYPGPKSSASFERVRTLPQQPDPPKVPEGPAPRWQARLGGQVYASPVVHDGIAYVGTTGGVFNAVDTRDGSLKWTYAAGRPIYGAATVTDDAVYFACDDGALHRLARADGKRAWRYALGDGATSRVLPHPAVYDWAWHGPEPLVDGDLVVVGDAEGTVHAIDAASGARRWRFDTRGAVRGGAAIAGTRVVVGSGDGTLYALERDTGREAWRFETGAPIETRPLVHDGRVLIGNRGYGLYAIDADSGKEAWKTFFWGSWVESTPVVVDGTLYIGASDSRRVSAIDPADGRVLWRTDVFGWTFGTPLVDGDVIHVGAAGGTPYFIRHLASYTTLDRRTGRILTRRAIPDPGGHQWGIVGSLARADDTVVYATLSGSLYGVPRR